MEQLVRYSLFRVIFPIVVGIFYVETFMLKLNSSERQFHGILVHILKDANLAKSYIQLGRLDDYIISINTILVDNGIILALYLLFAWVVGMFATFVSEIIIFMYIFNINILSNNDRIEDVYPFSGSRQSVRYQNFGDAAEKYVLEFSEVNYMLSNFFASLSVLFSLIALCNLMVFFLILISIVLLILLLRYKCSSCSDAVSAIRNLGTYIKDFQVCKLGAYIKDRLNMIVSAIRKLCMPIMLFTLLAFMLLISVGCPIMCEFLFRKVDLLLYPIAFISFILALSFRAFANKIIFYNSES